MFLWIMLILLSCDDIFVEDITGFTFQLQSPSPGLKTTGNQIKFRWEEVPGASSYQLEVVTPGFATAHKLVFDTLLETNVCDTIMHTGTYEWRVKAMNSAYSTGYFMSSFSILPEFNISTRQVTLQSPADQITSPESNFIFKWDSVEGAGYYRFRIKENNWAGDSVFGTNVFSTSCNFNLNDGIYAWGVAAVDTVTKKQTDYTVRTLTIDKTAPGIPQLVKPANQDTLYNPLVNLIWSKTGEGTTYNLEVYSDSELKNRIIEKQLTDTSTYINIGNQGMYFWRVNAADRFGNTSYFSPASVFEILLPADISNKHVQLLTPADKSTSTRSDVTFWWEETEGADNYRVQIVTSSFSNPGKLVFDQLSDSNSLILELEAGNYEWRVKAINSKYETAYSTASFTVYGTNLSDKKVSLLTPAHEALSNQSPVQFTWEKINANAGYNFMIKKNTWESGATVHDTNTNQTGAEVTLSDGTYVWGVKATDPMNGSSTEYSVRTLTVDLTKPETPKLKAPANNLVTEEYLIEFSWEPADATDNGLTYTLEIYQVLNNAVVQMTGKTTMQKFLNYNFEEAGTYKWRIYATDKAGNQSSYSEYRFLEIQKESNLSLIHVNLMAPADNLSTNLTSITFWWEKVPNAEVYEFQLVKPSFSNTESVIKNTEQTGTQIQLSLTPGSYQWRVKAKNDSSETNYTMRTLTIY